MQKSTTPKLHLHRETLAEIAVVVHGAASGTLTLEGSCGPTTCPCPRGGTTF